VMFDLAHVYEGARGTHPARSRPSPHRASIARPGAARPPCPHSASLTGFAAADIAADDKRYRVGCACPDGPVPPARPPPRPPAFDRIADRAPGRQNRSRSPRPHRATPQSGPPPTRRWQ
jgi:hypothetical protein